MKRISYLGIAIVPAVALLGPLSARGEAPKGQQLLEKVFGDAARFDAGMRQQVLDGTPGERHYVDADGDGRPEEVWFVDLALRHPENWRPVLVRVLDEDGDLEKGHEPDLDSDLYVADWKGDGTVDAVCDYTDRDGDGDVDEMGLYFLSRDVLKVWWGDDVGDDNLLWTDIGYTYNQRACQPTTHFGGSELFCNYSIDLADAAWLPAWENPFLFYDHDGDGVTEEVLRIEGTGDEVNKLRYSFDADNDGTPEDPRAFDVSISAHAPKGLMLDSALKDMRVLRGIPAGGFLSYEAAPGYSLAQPWEMVLLCWDENDLNIDGDRFEEGHFADPQERWEGVICKGLGDFPQIGGPSCGLLNKRYELDMHPEGTLRVYYAPTDQRIHLFGAEQMQMLVDLDYDEQEDAAYTFRDTDGDGYIDEWAFDADMDGDADDTWTAQGAAPVDLSYTYADLSGQMAPLMQSLPEALARLNARLYEALDKAGADGVPAWQDLAPPDAAPGLAEALRVKLLEEDEAWRFRLDVLKDRGIAVLKRCHADGAFWTRFDALRAQGDVAGMQRALEDAFDLRAPLPEDLLVAMRAGALAKYAKPRVAWAEDWAPPNIGWESDVAAYRAYWGQFDFFGKKEPCLVLPTFGPGQPSYHQEQPWGMDALHVNASAGLGGVTLYINGEGYAVWSPEGKGDLVWEKRLVKQTDDEVTIELTAKGVGPKDAPYQVYFQCSALAGRKDSPIAVRVEGGRPSDTLELGVNLPKIPQETFALDEAAGVMANWGVQGPDIGWIGMGVLFAPSDFVRYDEDELQHQAVLKASHGEAVDYRIQGDWLRGRRFRRCPTLENWMAELRAAR